MCLRSCETCEIDLFSHLLLYMTRCGKWWNSLVRCLVANLPASSLQHVGFVQRAYRQALHGSLQIFADFK